MWWDHQNLNSPRTSANGTRWNFRVWHDTWTSEGTVLYAQRVFYWDDDQTLCGVVLLPPGQTLHVSRLRALIEKLAAEPALREQHRCDIRFPLERHYSSYGAFPEERDVDG